MAGHSHAANVAGKKAKTDAARGKIFTKLGKELMVAVKSGGADPKFNPRLYDAISKAKYNNMTNDAIDRIIKKASGEGNADNYESITYEGYGIAGVAIIVEALTDNRNRTAGEVRHLFDKYGGNLGLPNSVQFMFNRCGVIIVSKKMDEDEALEVSIEAEADDYEIFEEGVIFYASVENFNTVKENLRNKGLELSKSEIDYISENIIALTDEQKEKFEKLIDALENNDDVQNVYHNADI